MKKLIIGLLLISLTACHPGSTGTGTIGKGKVDETAPKPVKPPVEGS